MQTREQKNAKQREVYHITIGPQQKAARRLRESPLNGYCKPDYGLTFNAKAVQTTLTKWGG